MPQTSGTGILPRTGADVVSLVLIAVLTLLLGGAIRLIAAGRPR